MIEIKGLDSLMQKLDSMGGNVVPLMAVNYTVRKGRGKRMVPVDTMLKQSISHEFERDGTSTSGTVYAFMPYAIHVEMGTYKMRAQPYMMPALNSHRSVFKSESLNRLQAAIRKL